MYLHNNKGWDLQYYILGIIILITVAGKEAKH